MNGFLNPASLHLFDAFDTTFLVRTCSDVLYSKNMATKSENISWKTDFYMGTAILLKKEKKRSLSLFFYVNVMACFIGIVCYSILHRQLQQHLFSQEKHRAIDGFFCLRLDLQRISYGLRHV